MRALIALDAGDGRPSSSEPARTAATYPGGKAQNGVFQTIINQIPPHRVYMEPFLGGAAVMRKKLPAAVNVGNDLDSGVIAAYGGDGSGRWDLRCGCALDLLRSWDWQGDEFVYLDPPYLFEVRGSGARGLYAHEFGTVAQHRELLDLVLSLPIAMAAVSGYNHPLYELRLAGWRRIEFPAVTRGGTVATEVLWMNYPEPDRLHDYRFLGANFRERERLRRQQARWRAKLARMPRLERLALLSVLEGEEDAGRCG